MPATRIQVLPRSKAQIYLKRAENLLATVELAEAAENADGVATAGVQAAVSLGDAFTVWTLQRRSRGQDHAEVVAVIARSESPGAPEVAKLLQKILNRKSDVEYGDREVRMADARQIAQDVRKLAKLVRAAVTE
jgi:hypothetical protein